MTSDFALEVAKYPKSILPQPATILGV